MTTCKTVQPRLTAYLDGELGDERGSVVRGHLRECADCRQIARDEAVLRDGLRALAPVDPPAALWAGVQARLAAAEVADARKPRWRVFLTCWLTPWLTPWLTRWLAPWTPTLPRFAAGGVVVAAAVVLLYWRTRPADEMVARIDPPDPRLVVVPVPRTEPQHQVPAPQVSGLPAGDVTEDLLAEPAQTTASYASAIEELMKLASEARSGWSEPRIAAFDTRVAALHVDVTRAAEGRPQQRAQRVLIRYLQGAVVREDIVLASGGAR